MYSVKGKSTIPPLKLDNMVYEMDPNKHGLALIINFTSYHPKWGPLERQGSEKDILGLKDTFSLLGFQIDDCQEETKDLQWLGRKLDQVAGRNDYSCLVVVMTHGNRDGSLMAYDDFFHVDYIWKTFENSSRGVPKLFFYQACRGDSYSPSVHCDAVPMREHVRIEEFSIPIPSDMMIGFSTWEGQVSGRYEDTGSFFIHELCKALKSDKGNNHILRVMTNVLKEVARNYNIPKEDSGEVYKQMPVIVYNFNKFLYLKPQEIFERKNHND